MTAERFEQANPQFLISTASTTVDCSKYLQSIIYFIWCQFELIRINVNLIYKDLFVICAGAASEIFLTDHLVRMTFETRFFI